MPTYRKKPVKIEAVQIRWDTWNEVEALFRSVGRPVVGVYIDPETGAYYEGEYDAELDPLIGVLVDTPEGELLAIEGDYIIKGAAGEIYPCKLEIFESTYDLVED